MSNCSALLLVLALVSLLSFSDCQIIPGSYPDFTSVGTLRPVVASSECGRESAENYCEYTTDAQASLIPNCIEAVCNGTCPFGAVSPSEISLAALGSFGVGVTTVEGRPGTASGSLRFDNSSVDISASRIPLVESRGLSFSTWINQDPGNTGTLISKSSSDGAERVYALSVSATSLSFDYQSGSQGFSTVIVDVNLDPSYWHLVTLTVYDVDTVFYVNDTVVGVAALDGPIQDVEGRDVSLGQLAPGIGFYNGLMQDIFFFPQALTTREVTELYTGSFPTIHLSSECHCPPSHPLIDPGNEATCIQQPGGLPSRGVVQRLNPEAHPASFANDFALSRGWITSPGQQKVNITFTLTTSLYELVFINLRYGAPRPRAAVWETSQDGGLTFNPVQYFSDDCPSYFGLPDDGPILNADDVNCITTSSAQTPTFNGDVRVHFLTGPRAGFNLDTSPELRQFILATHLRVRFVDYFESSTTPEHRYYSILEASVIARCACNGHADRCGSDIDSVCECVHNTQGLNCDQCLPFYNDKPWQYGTSQNAFPCKPCDCNGHASSCHYDPTFDPFPDSYDLGGGGVCDDCQNNTAGPRCETCAVGYFAPAGTLPTDPDPCTPCGCSLDGISDDVGDCAQGQGAGGEILGQCNCKSRVTGLKCDICEIGFFNLTSANPDGCTPCACNTAGTFDALDTCEEPTGQCPCKTNVFGLKCDQCRLGFTNLSADNVRGCEACQCDPMGAVDSNCDPVSGVCTCKPGVGGDRCDRCMPGFFGFSDSGCQPCTCLPEGSLTSVCDAVSGVCTCADNVMGDQCDACEDGFFDISAGCVSCDCNTVGTENGTTVCDKATGVCPCKTNVEGDKCDTCTPGFSNLSETNPDGCSECDCFVLNTDTSGAVCDPVSLQCDCFPMATGLRCDSCVDGFYQTDAGCVPCDCDSGGAVSDVCNVVTGQCDCQNSGLDGRTCDSCLPGFFQFPTCASCGCNPAGAEEGTVCNADTGECSCKLYVTGALCDTCVPGFQQLEASNPFGCSALPDEQAPPTTTPISATSILLQWLEPEAPNGLILSYTVYRDGSPVATVTTQSYTDTNLTPNTQYSYSIEAANSVGTTRSVEIQAQTLEGAPEGIDPPSLTALSAQSVVVVWAEPATPNGVVTRYEVVLVTLGTEQVILEETSVFNASGNVFSTVVPGLTPFTTYTFIIRACTSGGCGSSDPADVQTLQAPPTFQPAPNVTAISSEELLVTWVVPPVPNGIVSRYEVFQRDFPFSGPGISLTNTTSLSFLIQGLRPFVTYEFSVASFTAGGGIQSDWTQGTTAEAAPAGVAPPPVTSPSATSLQISWTEPASPNGIILRYGIYQVTMGTTELIRDFATEPGSVVLSDLSPFTEYSFLLEVCTSVGCTRSDVVTMTTLEGAPMGQPDPTITNVTSISASLMWGQPSQPNGIITDYSIQRRQSSAMPLEQDVGVAFDGNGIASFAAGHANLGGFTNEIRLQFRTLRPEGTLLYYINMAGSDLLAIELRDGLPHFVFDAGSGSGLAVPATQGLTFNDGQWHSIVASQTGQSGSILVDGIHMGTGTSPGTDGVVSSSQALHIGGIPSLAPLATTVGGVTLTGSAFVGCLFGVVLNGVTLDMSLSVPTEGVDLVNGCPVDVSVGWRLVGNGYIALQEGSVTDADFSVTFDLHTLDSDTLVFFVHSADSASALGVEIRGSTLWVVTYSNETTEIAVGAPNALCAIEDVTITLAVRGTFVLIDIGDVAVTVTDAWSADILSSALYFGGIPRGGPSYSLATELGLNVATPLSGCVRVVSLVSGGASVAVNVGNSYRVRFNGCGPRRSGCVPPADFSAGMMMTYIDSPLTSFTGYLYQVSASNSVGTARSGWVAATTLAGAPSPVSVSLVTSTADSLTITWTRPIVTRGLIASYDITATPISTVGLQFPIGSVSVATVAVTIPEMVLLATLNNLEPATVYEVTATSFTSGGQSTGTPVQISTGEEVPFGVQAPIINLIESRRLGVTWQQPTVPNGIIVRFDLFVDGEIRFSGPENNTIVSPLSPFTEYSLLLQACTSVGCSNSSMVMGQTLPDRPMGLAAPNLTALSPSSIEAVWDFPQEPNGAILRFELRQLFGSELAQFDVVFDGIALETTITGLTPNTLYTYELAVFNAGGFEVSDRASVRTLEGVPDGVSPPTVLVVDPTTLNVTWTEPSVPNGVITQYILLQNGTTIFTGLSFFFVVSNLQPFSYYSYSIMACTIRNCSSSAPVVAMTPEDQPTGYVPPTILDMTPFSIEIEINPVAFPNGIVTYILTLNDTDTVQYNSTIPDRVVISDLSPFTRYSFVLTVTNSAGSLVGPAFSITTDPTAPEGLAPPISTLLNATTFRIEWRTPSLPNGLIQSYEIILTGGGSTEILDMGMSLVGVISGLQPFTLYTVAVRANNTVGSVVSVPTNFTTGETAPTGFDRIVPLDIGPRHVLLSWDEPAAVNGILVNYTILIGGVVLAAAPPTSLTYNVTSLRPFTEYNFTVQACTSVGCVDSPTLVVMTTEDIPEGLPDLSIMFIGGRVLVTWTPPTSPNGIITEYRVERVTPPDTNISLIGTLSEEQFVVADIDTRPFTTYSYRLLVENGAGVAIGSFTPFTTPQAAPEGVSPPLLMAISSTTVQVTFTSPLTPNGIITTYAVRLLTPPTTFAFTLPNDTDTFSFNDTALMPYTLYTYTLEVCTDGGCMTSDSATVRTLEDTPTGVAVPTVTVVNSETLLVSWREPDMPNGVVLMYDFLRKFVGFEVVPNPVNCCEEYVTNGNFILTPECDYVTATDSNVTSIEDFGLRAFTYYQYCIVVTNSADSAFSDETTPTQTDPAPMPLAGPELIATTVNSTAIQLQWSSVGIEDLLGPLEGYTLYIRMAGGLDLGVELFSGEGLSFTATNLIASTEYVFVVAVSNGQGVAFSNNATAVTEEGIPANLAAPVVEAISATALSVTFREPDEPNGVIILYSIFLDSVVVRNATAPGTVILGGLTPFTLYIVRVEACTQFGCTTSDLVANRTLEGVPSGLASPFVTITGSTSANITWSAPNQPNGIITEYRLLQFTEGLSELTLVFSGISFAITLSNLQPFTTYNYQVIAFNGAGNVTSLVTTRTTDEAPPTFVPPPSLTVRSSVEIFVTWVEPNELNGNLIGYTLYRDRTQAFFSTVETSFSDRALEPASTYIYHLQVCTNGGCTNSSMVLNTTLEALPEGVANPELVSIGPRSAVINWTTPDSPNGVITEYILTLLSNNTVIFRGLDRTSFELIDLTPFTNYSFMLETCNSIGCVAGASLSIQTLEDIPEGLDAPRLRNLTSTEVAIEWSAPRAPNGEIITYVLRRGNELFPNDPMIIFQGLAFSFNDAGLLADTLYFYTVEAVNGAGSVTSDRSDFQTVPDLPGGIAPPFVEVRGAREIFVSWTEPTFPNGDIDRYILFINGNGIPLGIAFEYTARDLVPFTVYSFYFEVCNQAGCASSVTVTVVTDQAPPAGVSPPILTVLGSTSIQVDWTPPLLPNGIISRYEVRRQILGQVFTETIQHSDSASVLGFTNIGLTPFTAYEYRLNVFNGASPQGTFSDWVSAMTEQDIPAGISMPMFADEGIGARNVTATWVPPSMPNGVVLFYRLEYRILIDPSTNMPGSIITVDTYPADVTMAMTLDLLPVTTYEFRLVVINGAGEGRSGFETVTTMEDAPEDIQPIMVTARTGTSLSLSWNPPLTPNGQIREYILYLSGGIVHRNIITSVTIQGLQPFTSYPLQLAVCTSSGCGFGEIQSITTDMIAPEGQAPPILTALSAGSVQVTWSVPEQPNGLIIMYEVLRQNTGDPGSLTPIFNTADTLNTVYIDDTVRPATDYEYAVRAINAVGSTLSGLQQIRTLEAEPEGVPAPVLSVLSSSSISLSWTAPTLPNGVIQTYRVFRSGEGAFNVSIYDNIETMFTDMLLSPFTEYSYFIQACTLAGCASGPAATAITNEAIPTGLLPPVLSSESESSISIIWSPPANPNGIIVSYIVSISPGTIQILTSDLSRTVSNLLPFTVYTIAIEACNSVGCVQANDSIRTLESIPQFLRSPTLTAINATSIEVTWTEPSRPNGVVIRYILRRNGTTVFDGNEVNFTEASLAPDTYYAYTLQAFTSVGAGEETSATIIVTPRDTPEDISPPFVIALGPTSIYVTWGPPGQANGVIQRYLLLQNGVEVFSGLGFEYDAVGLQPFTEYVFQVMICTTTCGTSVEVTVTTLEAPPIGQAPSTLTPHRNTTVLVTWSLPNMPNGQIISYLIERRLAAGGTFELIANQSAESYLDEDPLLTPALTYEYRVTAVNSAGSVTSNPSTVTLLETAPERIPDLVVDEITATSISVTARPPSAPNGVLTNYTLYRNGTAVSAQVAPDPHTDSVSFTTSNLEPFTSYSLTVEVCTNGGCGQSSAVDLITLESAPTGLAPPSGTAEAARSIRITWSPPARPNGVIRGYSLWFRTGCPSPPQPVLSLPTCEPGSRSLIVANLSSSVLEYTFDGASGPNDPFPYSAYQFTVMVVNSVGTVESDYSSVVTTESSAPMSLPEGLVFTLDHQSGVITLDWLNAFHFNGQFVTSSVERNGILLVQRPMTSLTLTNEPRETPLTYMICVVTQLSNIETGQACITRTTEIDPIDTGTPTPNITTTLQSTVGPTDTPFYQQAAFIIGMVVLGFVLVFILIFCVCVLVICFVQPRGDKPFKVRSPAEFSTLGDVTPHGQGYGRLEHTPSPKHTSPPKQTTPSPKHVTGSWSPGDPYADGDIPEYTPDDQVVVTPRKKKYSPRRMESASLIENEHLQLPDTAISSHVSPQQFVPANDDFGSFRAQEHTTFTDTKV